MINLSSRDFQVVIGGQNLSDYVSSIEVTTADNDAGLIQTQGKIILTQLANGTFDLNNRTNPTFWQRGQPVLINVENQSGVLTRFRTLRVLQPLFDPVTLTQSCEIGCDLKLIDYTVVRACDIKSLDVSAGGNKSKTAIINDFLAYFGIPAIVGNVPGAIGYPIIGESDNLAQLAGRLAYDAGYSLWVNQQGQIVPVSRKLSTTY